MIALLGAVLSASFLGVALFFAVRAVGKIARRRWRPGLNNLGLSVGFMLLGVVVTGVVGFTLAKGVDIGPSGDPSGRARVLAELIAETMNCGAVIGILALCAGLFDAVWVQQKRTPSSRAEADHQKDRGHSS